MRASLIWLTLLLGLATGWGWWTKPVPAAVALSQQPSPAPVALPQLGRLSVCGVSLDDTWESALQKLGQPDLLEAECARWSRRDSEPSSGEVILFKNGAEISIVGPRVELDGQTIASKGQEAGSLERALGTSNAPDGSVYGWGWKFAGGHLVAHPFTMCGQYRGPGIYAGFTLSGGSLQPKLK